MPPPDPDQRRRTAIHQAQGIADAQGGGMDIVVLPTPAAVTTSNPELFASLARHWRRLSAKLAQAAKTRSAS